MIPVNEPWLDERESAAVRSAMDSGWISGRGECVEEFERRWAAICDRRYGVAVSSGTAALETAVHALGLPEGGEVILPTFTLIACATAVLKAGLTPVLVDADPRTWCIDPERIEERITDRTRAIMVVHIYGHPVDMDPVLELAEQHDLRIIEDAAEAHGARYRGRICGSFGDLSAFSFYSSKIVATGEGGMVLCDEIGRAARCRGYRNLYFGADGGFRHEALGQNFRFSNLHSAIGCAQIDKMPEALARKARMASLYDEMLADVPDLQLPARSDWADNVHWVYGVVLADDHPFDAVELRARLREAGVGSRAFFLGLHEQPALRGLVRGEGFPVAERLARRGLYLPSSLTITEEQIAAVVAALRRCLGR